MILTLNCYKLKDYSNMKNLLSFLIHLVALSKSLQIVLNIDILENKEKRSLKTKNYYIKTT